ncbi:MAG: GntR family transcriptional regulator [Paracoccaceae bacterium]|nr:GntR family transcriptional regulator [Paracoccaceae bacterium]
MSNLIDSTASVAEEAHAQIRHDIIFGHLKPGEKLRLDQMRSRYGVSVSTLRETLNRLAAEGFVLAEGQRGFEVAPVSAENLHDIATLRTLLECHALALSFAAGGIDWEAGLVAAHHKLHQMELRMMAGDHSVKEEWKRYDWEFHRALIAACGSRELVAVHSSVFDKYLRYQMRVLTFRGETAAREHRELLAAAMDRDAARAQEILRAHIDGGVRHCLASGVLAA